MSDLTWGDLKRAVEAAGAGDTTTIGFIELTGGDKISAIINENGVLCVEHDILDVVKREEGEVDQTNREFNDGR